MKKTITIEVPDGLPDGWECCGYGEPIAGETMYHCNNEWVLTSSGKWANCWLIARRTETAADWANKQPILGVLASIVGNGCKLCLFRHATSVLIDSEGAQIYIYAEKLPEKWFEIEIVSKNGKWINA